MLIKSWSQAFAILRLLQFITQASMGEKVLLSSPRFATLKDILLDATLFAFTFWIKLNTTLHYTKLTWRHQEGGRRHHFERFIVIYYWGSSFTKNRPNIIGSILLRSEWARSVATHLIYEARAGVSSTSTRHSYDGIALSSYDTDQSIVYPSWTYS